MSGRFAFVTLVTSDTYLPGALAVAAALKEIHTSPPVDPEVPFQTVCIVTPETVDVKTVKHLRRAFDSVIGVEVIDGQTAAELQLLGRPDLHNVLTKLHVFRLVQFDKVIFLDADVLPVRPLSHLFTLPHEFSAVPDVGWPDIFNSGMMVLTPGEDKFNEIMNLVKKKGSWDGGDQGVLNEWRGSDWNRLSFTYNTTPTAAYTYAPAYERFGSQISAIHFIGTNKPWNEIPFRAPSSASQAYGHEHQAPSIQQTASTTETQEVPLVMTATAPVQSYAYGSLVDRWFEVYDRNYRQPAPTMEREFEARKYENVWDDKVPEVPEITPGGALGLEDLRKLAMEGGTLASRQEGEGEYRSLPLQGRIDLMRPKQGPSIEHTAPTLYAEGEPPRSPVPSGDHSQLPGIGQAQWLGTISAQRQQAATPGPNEVPPSPQLAPLPLPSSSYVSPAPSMQVLPDSEVASRRDLQTRDHYRDSKAGVYDQPGATSSPVPSQPTPGRPHSHESPTVQNLHFAQQDTSSQDYHPPPPGQPQRPVSPPLISWNPAIEPPPNVTPTSSAFPSDAYFPNAWDIPTRSHNTGYTPTSSHFFEPPPHAQIPQHLISEGHYSNVTGPRQEKSPQPDVSKVTSVFPWEQRPRHIPGRVFPSSDPVPLGGMYIENLPATEPGQESGVLTPEMTHEERVQVASPQAQLPSPPIGFPGARGFANAWDSVPSIQKYAARLVKPSSASLPLTIQPPRVRKRTDSYRSRGEQSDANSMDGDVEDEIDDNESEPDASGRFSSSERSTNGRSRRGSKSSITSPPSGTVRSKSGKKEYRSYGVQTIPKEVRSIGVQVSQAFSPYTGKSDGKETPKPEPPRSKIDLPEQATIEELQSGLEPTALTTPSTTNIESFIRSQSTRQQQHIIPSGMVSPRLHETYAKGTPNQSPPSVSPGTQTPTQRRQTEKLKLPQLSFEQARPLLGIVTRASSQETADSPLGPVSPVDAPQTDQSKKSVGRRWNPATGVDVFKRSSEEVLARFLRLGSWEDDPQQSTRTHG